MKKIIERKRGMITDQPGRLEPLRGPSWQSITQTMEYQPIYPPGIFMSAHYPDVTPEAVRIGQSTNTLTFTAKCTILSGYHGFVAAFWPRLPIETQTVHVQGGATYPVFPIQ